MKILALIFLIYPIISKIPENAFINYVEENKDNFCDKNKLKLQEYIFECSGVLPTITLIIGCFLTLYGAYYNFFMIFEFTLFLYYLIGIFMTCNEEEGETNFIRNHLFVLVFTFITGILLYLGYRVKMKLIIKYIYVKKIFYGMFTGCFLCEIIIHFIYSFKDEYNQNIYYALFPILIVVLGLGTIFIPDKFFSIPCSVISGSFFIQLTIDNILIDPYKLYKSEKILSLIFFIFMMILSFLYQIYHLRRKKMNYQVLLMKYKQLLKKILILLKMILIVKV